MNIFERIDAARVPRGGNGRLNARRPMGCGRIAEREPRAGVIDRALGLFFSLHFRLAFVWIFNALANVARVRFL